MIPKECKRLIEVDFPIAEVGRNSLNEINIKKGLPRHFHQWWARRPLAACRSVILGILLPDPCDKSCPEEIKKKISDILENLPLVKAKNDKGLRQTMLDFIAKLSDIELAKKSIWINSAKQIVKLLNNEPPLIVDPFAGGGSIPYEGRRIGCDVYASDLNPVSVMILEATLQVLPHASDEMLDTIISYKEKIKIELAKNLSTFYTTSAETNIVSYLWARTVKCESPNCGIEIPTLSSLWLSQKKGFKRALKPVINLRKIKSTEINFEIYEPKNDVDVKPGNVDKGNILCFNPSCNSVLPVDRVKVQFKNTGCSTNVLFDENGRRIGGARLIAIVEYVDGNRKFRLPNDTDYADIFKAHTEFTNNYVNKIPQIQLPEARAKGNSGFRVINYGMKYFSDLFTERQKLTLLIVFELVRNDNTIPSQIKNLFYLGLGKCIRHWNTNSKWHKSSLTVAGAFGRQAIPMTWDFPESYPLSKWAGNFDDSIDNIVEIFRMNSFLSDTKAEVQQEDACESMLPDESCDIWFTDPPYYDAVAYADLSDFYGSWFEKYVENFPNKRSLFDPEEKLSPKSRELIKDINRVVNGIKKNGEFFEKGMMKSFEEGRRVLKENGIGCIVFAHKTTEGWEALLTAILEAGWYLTSSWPITTERQARLLARETSALATSVHLICRPRSENAPTGEWEEILRQLPKRIKEWVIRLDNEGIHGADLVFSCIGPALELFSKYRKVETAEGEEVKLGPNDDANGEAAKRGFLSYIWEVVGRTALELVLSGDSDEGIGTLEEDARLCALFLWTYQSTEIQNGKKKNGDAPKIAGLSLPYDIVRRFAQPLGIHLPDWEDRIIKTEKGVVKLIPILKRAKQLFGEDITAAASHFEMLAKEDPQMELPLAIETAQAPEIGGRRRKLSIAGEKFEKANSATTLDKVHAAMLLQTSGKTNALRALLKQEIERGPEFLRLANSLSALFPSGLEEKRLLDAMLLVVPK